jgi:hypothetical protein
MEVPSGIATTELATIYSDQMAVKVPSCAACRSSHPCRVKRWAAVARGCGRNRAMMNLFGGYWEDLCRRRVEC